ncbi:MAG: PQQ-dependent dehydrogenase, methanol/ethanol family [Halieaceae bacterium]
MALPKISALIIPATILLLGACGRDSTTAETVTEISSAAPVSINTSATAPLIDGARIENADATPEEWLSHGRTYDEQRFSPLTEINDKNVGNMGLAWFADLPTRRGIETTPLMADGKLFVTGTWSRVYTYNAKTGELLWEFDPKVPKDYGVHACCDVVNRGAALWGDKVYVGSLDGRMIALSRDTGDVVWQVDTRINTTDSYTITGAPRIVNGKVIIGNGGAEMGVRGYVSAYDAESGALVWRFFTVPGNPADGFEDETQERIAKTWTGKWWENGKGGGTAWDAFAFDPALNLLYIGVGNASSWNQKIRSPDGGDNLFVSSIVAVDADTGKYVWHYQTTPGDHWDYTATQHMILAEIEIAGQPREVIIQAPKNGFFYVLDRASGELLSAEKYMPVTWASHVDMETGRPVEAPGARDGAADTLLIPGPSGAHNWHPMSYSPQTGYVYIPAMLGGAIYKDDFYAETRDAVWNTNYDAASMVAVPDELPADARAALGDEALQAFLIARDPATNTEAWRIPRGFYSAGGLLTTAGNLIFQGDLQGEFSAFAADTGTKLWSQSVQGGVMAAPITYEIDGEQYVAVVQGWGGETGLPFGAITGPRNMVNISRVLVYRLGASLALPHIEVEEQALPVVELAQADAATVEQGRRLYNIFCVVCHGGNAISGGLVPDLRYRINDLDVAWQAIVMDGGLRTNGMPAWDKYMTAAEADEIKAYVVHEARLGNQRGEKRLVRK